MNWHSMMDRLNLHLITQYIQHVTGGKDESNIVFMRKSLPNSQHGTKNIYTEKELIHIDMVDLT
jgi:hypothetical protein